MRHLDLYPHNQKAYIELEKMLAECGRAAIIHPTGTGKSYIAFALALAHPDKYFAWFAPSEYIFNHQTDMLWNKQHIRLSNVEFHTYTWITCHKEVMEGMNPDYIILDEFHRAGAVEWGRCINRLVELYPNAKLVGLSATNIRYLDHRRDMADEIFEGCVASEMGLCEAMAREILPTPKYVIATFPNEESLDRYNKHIERMTNASHKKRTLKMLEHFRHILQFSLGMDEILKKHLPLVNAKIIVFCKNAEHMMELIAREPEWFGKMDPAAHVYHVYSESIEAEEDFRRFVEDESSHLKLLYCIDMLNEGIHVDDVDAVILCRPTTSPIIYKQQIGRAIAAGNSKKPVIFDMVNNFDNLNKIDEFKEELQSAVKMYGAVGDKVYEDVSFFEIVDELKDCRKLLEEIQRNLDSTWDTYYQSYKRYTEEYGTAVIERRFISDDGLFLGKWVFRQRRRYLDGIMSEEEIRLLEMLGIDWMPMKERNFERWVECLKRYIEEHGTSLVPVSYRVADGRCLGQWCYNVRGYYRAGKLSDKRIQLLDELGFQWDAYDYYWCEGYRHAKDYYMEHGNLLVPRRYVCGDGYRLGNWIGTQRAVRKGNCPGIMNEDKITKLDELGMDWEGAIRVDQGVYLNALIRYKAEYGHDLIPCQYVDKEGVRLGAWITKVRMERNKGIISLQKSAVLEKAGVKLHDFTHEWYSYFLRAKAFYEENGHVIIPSTYKDKAVSQWVYAQRRAYFGTGPGILSEEQRGLLEEIAIYEGSRWARDFERGFMEFKKYIDEHNDTLVPLEYVSESGFKLGHWVGNLRDAYRDGKIKTERYKRLDALGMIWGNNETVKAERFWNEMYMEAVKYAQAHGSIYDIATDYVTEEGKKLGSWISQMRGIRKGVRKHNSIKMDEERIKRLDALGMNWEPPLYTHGKRRKGTKKYKLICKS